jgi:hypothetical protein
MMKLPSKSNRGVQNSGRGEVASVTVEISPTYLFVLPQVFLPQLFPLFLGLC